MYPTCRLPYDVPKLNEAKKIILEGELTSSELTAAIKRAKNGKSPGSDGFTNEF